MRQKTNQSDPAKFRTASVLRFDARITGSVLVNSIRGQVLLCPGQTGSLYHDDRRKLTLSAPDRKGISRVS